MRRLILVLLVKFVLTQSDGQDDLMQKLVTAVTSNNPLEIVALVKEGGNVNGTTESGESLVHLAVQADSRSSIIALGFLKADLEALDATGATPMEEAIRYDRGSCIRQLHQSGASIKKRVFRGDSYLHIAAFESRNNALEALLQEGLDPDIKNYLNETALIQATYAGNAEGVKLLLKGGANTELVSKAGKRPFQIAVELGNVDVIKAYIDHGAPKDVKFENGDTWVHKIVRAGNATNMIEVLKGQNVNKRNDDGLAPLHVATDPYTVTAMIQSGADVNITTTLEGETALHIASANGSLEVVKVLLSHNAGVNIKDSVGNTPLMKAVENSHLPVVTFLLISGADPTIKNGNGLTALHYSGYCDAPVSLCVKIMNVLVQAGAKVNERDIDGFTPAFLAAINNKLEILKFLVKNGADLNLRGIWGAGIIHEAAFRGFVDIVSYLLDEGVSVDSKDLENGYTALHYATLGGRKKMVSLLLERGADPISEALTGQIPQQLAISW